jgi:hypothetical protein
LDSFGGYVGYWVYVPGGVHYYQRRVRLQALRTGMLQTMLQEVSGGLHEALLQEDGGQEGRAQEGRTEEGRNQKAVGAI